MTLRAPLVHLPHGLVGLCGVYLTGISTEAETNQGVASREKNLYKRSTLDNSKSKGSEDILKMFSPWVILHIFLLSADFFFQNQPFPKIISEIYLFIHLYNI